MDKLNIFETPKEVAEAFARQLFQLVNQSDRSFHIALSGGSTPLLLFDHLAHDYFSQMPWNKIHFWWGDERCVPPSDDQSNYKMASDHLFNKITVESRQIHRIMGELPPEQACGQYIREIETHLNQQHHLPVFDLIMLGMGDDGHTASIFPNQMELLHAATTCEVTIHPQSGQHRVSLTGPVLNNAAYVSFLVTGKSKATRMAQIINHEPEASALPAYHVQPGPGRLSFYLDREAASGIK